MAESAARGWCIDDAVAGAEPGSLHSIMDGLSRAGRPSEDLLQAAAQHTTPAAHPLRCFTIGFWRSARPDLTPVFAYDDPAASAPAPFMPEDLSERLWRLSVLASLNALAGEPAVIVRGPATDAVASATNAPAAANDDVAPLTASSTTEEMMATLQRLEGRHDRLPHVVEEVAFAAALSAMPQLVDQTTFGSVQLYWAQGDQEFVEDRSFAAQTALGPLVQTLRLPVPRMPIDALRLDPIDRDCRLYMSGIRLVTSDGTVTEFSAGERLLSNTAHSDLEQDSADPRVFVASGGDPHLIFSVALRPAADVETFLELDIAAIPSDLHEAPGLVWPALTEAEDPLEVPGIVPVDLTTWVTDGFHPDGGWSTCVHDDPALVSGTLAGPPGETMSLRMAVKPCDAATTGTLYVAGGDGVFSERESIHFDVVCDGAPHGYVLRIPEVVGSLPRASIRHLRLDPVSCKATFRIESLAFGSPPESPKQDGQPLAQLVEAVADRTAIVSIGRTDYVFAMGGMERRITDEAAAASAAGYAFIHVSLISRNLTFSGNARMKLQVRLDSETFVNVDAKDIAATIAALEVTEFRVHHLMGWTWSDIGALMSCCDAPVRYFTHDYFAICPGYNLLRNGRSFCGAPPLGSPACSVCDTAEERQRVMPLVQSVLEGVSHRLTVQCPSEPTAEIYRNALPALADRVQVRPHERLVIADRQPAPALPAKLTLAFVGVAEHIKGWPTWERLRTDPAIVETYNLLHVGLNGTHGADRNVVVDFRTGGTDAMERTLREEDVHLAIIWSITPETFSFVAAEAIAAGCAVLTSPMSGNVARMVDDHRAGLVLLDENALRDFLLSGEPVAELVGDCRHSQWKREQTDHLLDLTDRERHHS